MHLAFSSSARAQLAVIAVVVSAALPKVGSAQELSESLQIKSGDRANCVPGNTHKVTSSVANVGFPMTFVLGDPEGAHRRVEVSYDSLGRPAELTVAIFDAPRLDSVAMRGIAATIDSLGRGGGILLRATSSLGGVTILPDGGNVARPLTAFELDQAVFFARILWGARCGNARTLPNARPQ